MDWPVGIALGVLAVGLVGLIFNQAASKLSVREYESYTAFIVRELDAIRERITFLEQTRPTTGELEAKLGIPKKCI